jgi:outer membrane lipoprotein SlyB
MNFRQIGFGLGMGAAALLAGCATSQPTYSGGGGSSGSPS